MIDFRVFLMVCMIVGGGYGQGNVNVDPQPPDNSTPSLPPQPTTANVTTPAPTTPAPNVTTTTTTLAPNTTTAAPNTTTSAPITTTAAPNTTTSAPNTTTSAPITTSTTAKPTPAPTPVDPKVGNWTVNYVNSTRSCIILAVAAQFEVLDAKTNKTVKINIPVNATASGSCDGNTTQTLVVAWAQNNSVEFYFEKTNTSKFDLSKIVSTLYISEADGAYELFHNKSEFSTPLKNSYKCARTQTLDLTQGNSNITVGHLHVSHLQYQAFHNSTEHKFDSALDCEGTSTPDIVPIVVGCVLAALVVAVLVAYLFGRRRCQARGYLSIFSSDDESSRPLVQ